MDTLVTGDVKYTGRNSDKGLSPALWGRIPLSKMVDPNSGKFVFDDFLTFGGTVATNVGTYASGGGAYLSYEDTGGSIAQLATSVLGEVKLTTDTTDNDEVWMQPGGAASVLGAISNTAGNDCLLIFEARVKLSQITSGNAFVGLSEEALAAADTITDADALADKDLIGFAQLAADLDAFQFVYRKAGQSVVQVEDVAHTIVADTYVKLGFVYDPLAPAAKRITIYVNGTDIGVYVTATNIAAATFPNAEELNALFGVKNGAAAAKALTVDWWAFFQEKK
jgi:hypothetical protein